MGVVASGHDDAMLDGDNDDGDNHDGDNHDGDNHDGADVGLNGDDGSATEIDATGDFDIPPPVVYDCGELGEVDEWQEIPIPKPPGYVLPPDETGILISGLATDPHRPGVVYVSPMSYPVLHNRGLGLWRSEDCGATWELTGSGENGQVVNKGTHPTLLFDPRDPDVLITGSFYGNFYLYRSENRGTDWRDITPREPGSPAWVTAASMDPTDPDHLLVTFHETCTGDVAGACLAETRDGGDSWRMVHGPSVFLGWAEGAGPHILGGDTWLFTSVYTHGVFFSDDAGENWEGVIGGPGCFGTYARAPNGDWYLPCADALGIQHSSNGRDWSKLAGAPPASAFIAAGPYWVASYKQDHDGNPFARAPIDNPTAWSAFPSPTISAGCRLAYDDVHHVLYAGCDGTAGFWRVRLE